jgi:ribosomal 50S subunit-recycling heat shock protein
MRLDKYLKVSRIIKRRTVANEACDLGRVELNGRVAKAGAEVKPGDTLSVLLGGKRLNLRILSTQEHVAKADATGMYELLQEGTK